MKRLFRKSKERADVKFGRKIAAKYQENIKLIWKDFKRNRGKSDICRIEE